MTPNGDFMEIDCTEIPQVNINSIREFLFQLSRSLHHFSNLLDIEEPSLSTWSGYSLWFQTVVDTAQQTTKVIEGAKPIASATVETISSSDPTVIAGTAGALFIAYLLLPPIWSAVSFNFRGYKGTFDVFWCKLLL